jgi:uncharacterized protein (TIGR03435 family)
VTGIPRTIIFGPDGRIAADTFPDAVDEEMLAAIVAGKQTADPIAPPFLSITPGSDPDAAARPPLYQITIRPTDRASGGRATSRGRMTADAVNVSTAVALAYEVRPTRVVCPAALDEQRYTIIVNAPPARQDRCMEQFQSALKVAFGVTVSAETRELDGFVLTVPDGVEPKLTPGSAAAGAKWGAGRYAGAGQSMADLTRYVEETLGKPVLDETGLEGKYDFEIKYDDDDPVTLIEAVREQLGLVPHASRPVEVLVVAPE